MTKDDFFAKFCREQRLGLSNYDLLLFCIRESPMPLGTDAIRLLLGLRRGQVHRILRALQLRGLIRNTTQKRVYFWKTTKTERW